MGSESSKQKNENYDPLQYGPKRQPPRSMVVQNPHSIVVERAQPSYPPPNSYAQPAYAPQNSYAHQQQQQPKVVQPRPAPRTAVPAYNPAVYNARPQPPAPPQSQTFNGALPKSFPTKKVINLDEALPSIKKKIAAHSNEDFGKLTKLLNSNQPLGESRKFLVNNPFMADVMFCLNEKYLYGHKAFLITSSALFRSTFAQSSEMVIESIDEETFLMLLTYCYTTQLKLTPENVLPVLEGANQLEIRQATNICHGFISNMINAESVFSILEKAIERDNEMFQKKCLDFIFANEAKCFNSRGFFGIKLESLMGILARCKFDSAKSSELIEKWNHGALASSMPTAAAPAVAAGAKKKPPPKQNQPKKKNYPNQPKIPSLVDLVIPSPPFAEGPAGSTTGSDDLILFDDEDDSILTYDDDDDGSDIICVDEDKVKTEVGITVAGTRKTIETEIARLDFVAKRKFALHSIWFCENLFASSKEVTVTVTAIDKSNKQQVIHRRVVKNNKPGMKMNFVKFSKKPLTLHGGQQFVVKVQFPQKAPRTHVNPDTLSSTNFFVLKTGSDGKVKKYFNSITKLVVS